MSDKCPLYPNKLSALRVHMYPDIINDVGIEWRHALISKLQTELVLAGEWRRGATRLFNKWLYLEENGLLSCAFSPKILARETNVFITIPEVVKKVRENP